MYPCVSEGPRIREYERKVLVAVGDQARLRCKAEGIPMPNITWYRADRQASLWPASVRDLEFHG